MWLPREHSKMRQVTKQHEHACTGHQFAGNKVFPSIRVDIFSLPLVSGSFRKTSKQSTKLVPLNGSPPIPKGTNKSIHSEQVIYHLPTHRDCPNPTLVVCHTASYVRVPDLDTMPAMIC